MRLAYYAGASTAAAAACLLKAFHERPNFYSATVYLSQSNACLLILTNLMLVMACSFMFALQRLLYGPLRPIEIEQLSEKAWYAVLDTLLAMPSFREDVGGWLLTMFVLLLAGKVWGWIGEGRVDILEQQPPANPRLFHARLATSLTLSVLFDILMLNYCIETVVADPRPGMMVIFTFEFAILCIFSSFTLMRYALAVWEMAVIKKQTKQAIEVRKSEIRAEREAARQTTTAEDGTPVTAPSPDEGPIEVDENEVDVPGWEEKRRYLFGLEVLTDFLKLMIYIVFFTVSITFNGLPMHIMRDVYMTFASFSKRVTDYVAYRTATRDMNSRYPDATTEEIRGDSCIVCRESMAAWEEPTAGTNDQPAVEQAAVPRRRDEGLRAKKLPCGHILHLRCLKAWLERQQVCPTCRRPVINATSSQTTAGGNGNQPAPGQQGQPQPPRPRARIFNIGPLRVGLLNAPNNQMQNIINQIQNPDAQNQNAVNQQGPNHLGLQVPYANQAANGQQGATSTRATVAARATVPVNVQLMQLEQRIMQEAHNLGIEQQQLHNLRAMETELARLRAHHVPTQQVAGTNGAQRQVQNLPHQGAAVPLQGYMPLQPMMPLQLPRFTQPRIEALHGVAAQQMGSGSETLPDGLVLPEGWSLMPLHRIDGNQRPATTQMQPLLNPQSTEHRVPAASENGPSDPVAAAAAQSLAASAQSGSAASQNAGPTDDNGSPLFLPSQNTDSAHVRLSAAQHEEAENVADLTGTGPIENEQKNPRAEATTPWAGDSWSFAEPGETTSLPSSGVAQPSGLTNGHAPEQSERREGRVDKGKGRAVEIEDAPDPDAGT